jgi:mannitol/fructose-specific phosphotransferase system IIA component (Ntr-type)
MVIPPEHIFPDLEATDRYAAIREILQRLIRLGAIPNHAEETLFAAICHREEVITTGIGMGARYSACSVRSGVSASRGAR